MLTIPAGLTKCEILEIIRLNGITLFPPVAATCTAADSSVFTDSSGVALVRNWQSETADCLKNGSGLFDTVSSGAFSTLRIGINKSASGVNSSILLRGNGDIAQYGGNAADTAFSGLSIRRLAGLNNNAIYTNYGSPTTHVDLIHKFANRVYSPDSEDVIMTLSGTAITFYKAQSTVSDVSTKKDINDLSSLSSLEKVRKISPISFKRNGVEVEEIGFSANEVEQIDSRLASKVVVDGKELLAVDGLGITATIMSALKELTVMVETLTQRVKTLEAN